MVRISAEERERAIGLPVTASPDAGIAWAVHRWAAGQRLDAVLRQGVSRRAISSGGASRLSTSWTRSPAPPGTPPAQ